MQSYFWIVFWELGLDRCLLLSSVDAGLESSQSKLPG